MHNDELHDRLISGREADLIAGTSRSRRYELVKAGQFPKPVKVGKLTKFSYRELQAYVRDVLSQREGGNA
jgi:predicted DNA-binding transcriptional regulator AlpA